jgi:predicted RNA binding protein YcfA (HicA-like mRNA interferase family)
MRAREVVARIKALGGFFVRQHGSHALYRAEGDGFRVQTTVPMHTGDIPRGTLRAMERDMEPVFGKGWLR